MKIEKVACPTCGAPLPDFAPNQQIECASCGSVLLATDLEAEKTVVCPNCRTVNPIEQRYCARCGDSLKEECIRCHTENKVGATYCINCGAHLEQARRQRQKMQEGRRRLQEEREQLLQEKESRQKQEKLRRLLAALDEPQNHDFAIFQINQMGAEAVKGLIDTLLNDGDVDARYGSAKALGQICAEHEVKGLIKARAAKALVQALADPEPIVRYWAAEALGKCKKQTAIAPLAALLKDSHLEVRQQARQALQAIGGDKVQAILADHDKPRGFLGWRK